MLANGAEGKAVRAGCHACRTGLADSVPPILGGLHRQCPDLIFDRHSRNLRHGSAREVSAGRDDEFPITPPSAELPMASRKREWFTQHRLIKASSKHKQIAAHQLRP